MIENFIKRTWAEIHLDNIMHNFMLFKNKLRHGVGIMAVVKANAYGHGANRVSEMLEPYADWFAVSNLKEALNLRVYGIRKPILVFGYTPCEHVRLLSENDISQAVYSKQYAESLSLAALKAGVSVRVHLKIDTGMSRIGFPINDMSDIVVDNESANKAIECNDNISQIIIQNNSCSKKSINNTISDVVIKSSSKCVDECISNAECEYIKNLSNKLVDMCRKSSNLMFEGIFTHFSSADDLERGYWVTEKQHALFTALIEKMKLSGVTFKYEHCSNSAASMHYSHMQHNLIRIGISLYGLTPDNENQCLMPLMRGMTLKTVVSMVKSVPQHVSVSYGGTYKTEKPSTLVTVPMGYADGYPRLLSNKGLMFCGDTKLRVAGRVCMDQIVLLSERSDIKQGNEISVFGYNSPQTTEEFAKMCGTINYEVTCGISMRVPRVYYKDGKVFAVDDFTP